MIINYIASADLNLPESLKITGDLTVNAPNATVNNNATVSGTITITDVSSNTWNENTSGNSLVFNAAGKTLNVGANVAVKELTVDAADAKVTVSDTATFTNPVLVNKSATIVSPKPVLAKVANEVEVTLKADESNEGIKITGNGAEAATIDPAEVNRVMDQLKDNMFDTVVYPGKGSDESNPYTLSTMVGDNVKELTTDENIILSVGNKDTEYGYYRVTLTVAGATATKDILVDTVTVNSADGFKDALTFNINKIILAADITVAEKVDISKLETIVFGDYTLTINGETISRAIKDADSFIELGGALTEDKGVYSTSFTWGSINGIGTLNEQSSGSYNYYTDGAFLRFTVKQDDQLKKFNEVFKTYADGNNEIGGMTLQTDSGKVNDMDGSFRELADWGDVSKAGYATKLPGENSVFYGVIQGADYGTKTVGFDAGDIRTINMTLEPLENLSAGTYTVEVEVVQQTTEKVFGKISYAIVVQEVVEDTQAPTATLDGFGSNSITLSFD